MVLFNRIKGLKVGHNVEFINKGYIEAKGAYLGYIENETVRFANKSFRSYLKNYGEIALGNNVRIHKGFGITVAEGSKLTIGDNTYINPDAILVCKHAISIGKNCAISWNCEILDDDLHEIYYADKIETAHPIEIGDNVWIGSGVKIQKGVKIGNNVVIASGAVVVKDIPTNCLAAGIPAKVIRSNISWK